MDKDEVAEVKLWDTDGHHNTSTKRPSGAQLAANLNFDFPQVVRQHTLGVVAYLVWVLFTICSSSRVKEFWKSIRSWHSYHHQLGGPLFGTQSRWNSTGCHRRLCLRLLCPLTFWPNQYVSCASTYMTQFWWKYSRRYYIHPIFGSLPLVTVTFDLLTPKANQHIYEPKYLCDRNCAKFSSLDQ